jgi:Protein kinase domain
LGEKQALLVFWQLILALRSLHDNFILHRDIKPNNIFFKSHHLKLADFGFCKKLRSSDDFTQTSLGSPLYMAPEIMNGDVYGSKADVWSCGIVLFEMLFGYCPYGHCNIKEMLDIYNNDKNGIVIPSEEYPISAVTELMLRRMLEKDQFRRISW